MGTFAVGEEENEITRASHQSLCDYTQYLRGLPEDLLRLDWAALQADLDHKLYFDSSIPQGYGVGSSGALVAAFYDRYALDKISPQDDLSPEKLARLKSIFAAMESYFHGQSSGLDPLNSYLSLPLLIHSKNKIEPTGIPKQNPRGKGAVFLIDTGSSGATAPMVSLFMENMKEEGFRKMMREDFPKRLTAAGKFFKGNLKSLWKHEIAVGFGIAILNPWSAQFHGSGKRTETNAYYLKLCGSGVVDMLIY